MRDIINKLMEIDINSNIRTLETVTFDDMVWEVYTLFDRINNASNGFKSPSSVALAPDDIFEGVQDARRPPFRVRSKTEQRNEGQIKRHERIRRKNTLAKRDK